MPSPHLHAGDLLGIPASVMADGLLSFHGTDRRFQKKGVIGGVTIIDDYAHHPTEIKATLQRGTEFSMQASLVRLPATHLHADQGAA